MGSFEAIGTASALSGDLAGALGTLNNPQKNVTAVSLTASEVPAQYQAIFSAAGGAITQLNEAVYEVVIPRPDESNYRLGGVPASASLGVLFRATSFREYDRVELRIRSRSR